MTFFRLDLRRVFLIAFLVFTTTSIYAPLQMQPARSCLETLR